LHQWFGALFSAGEFEYFDPQAWRKLKPLPIERVLADHSIYAGLEVIESDG